MKTATTFSSGFVTCLAAVSIACGGGGEMGPRLSDECHARAVSEANALMDDGLRCRIWYVADQQVDGVAYPDFMIGGEQ